MQLQPKFRKICRNYFSHRIVPIWNSDSLPDSVVSAEAGNSFKSRLDKFWSMHDFVYDYRADPEVKCNSYIIIDLYRKL